MDVQRRSLILAGILILGVVLRLKGLHNPLLDHPGWRQGDTASIAKNFALLRFNPLYPQTNYNGPPPNYVELELQIVPLIAAALYKIVGIHEVLGRLISIAFSAGTIAVLYFFGRRLFVSELGGFAAAGFFAVMPGAFYYGRTFTPDTTMVFFLSAALYVLSRMFMDEHVWRPTRTALATALLAAAFLAKPVAVLAIVPVAGLAYARLRAGWKTPWLALCAIVFIPLALLTAYDRAVAAHAEWHWVSGITTLHVLPSLAASFHSWPALQLKLRLFRAALDMLASTMIGPGITVLALLGVFVPPADSRSRAMLYGWLAAGLLYAYVVVTVERVDYYLYALLPLGALFAAGFALRVFTAVASSSLSRATRAATLCLAVVALAAAVVQNIRIVQPYYAYNKQVYRNALALAATLPPNTLVVMGHYDPSVLYYIGRYGWEEDPYLWTPFDEQSAIRKGARYFIDIERNRFGKNVELCAWMQRFPVMNASAQWPVYITDPARIKPNAEQTWRQFRIAEKRGSAREWLDARGLCSTAAAATNRRRAT